MKGREGRECLMPFFTHACVALQQAGCAHHMALAGNLCTPEGMGFLRTMKAPISALPPLPLWVVSVLCPSALHHALIFKWDRGA